MVGDGEPFDLALAIQPLLHHVGFHIPLRIERIVEQRPAHSTVTTANLSASVGGFSKLLSAREIYPEPHRDQHRTCFEIGFAC